MAKSHRQQEAVQHQKQGREKASCVWGAGTQPGLLAPPSLPQASEESGSPLTTSAALSGPRDLLCSEPRHPSPTLCQQPAHLRQDVSFSGAFWAALVMFFACPSSLDLWLSLSLGSCPLLGCWAPPVLQFSTPTAPGLSGAGCCPQGPAAGASPGNRSGMQVLRPRSAE